MYLNIRVAATNVTRWFFLYIFFEDSECVSFPAQNGEMIRRKSNQPMSLGAYDSDEEEDAPPSVTPRSGRSFPTRRNSSKPYNRPPKQAQGAVTAPKQIYVSDGSRVYLKDQIPAELTVANKSHRRPFLPRRVLKRALKKAPKIVNPLQHYIFPSNAGKSLLPKPPVSHIATSDSNAASQGMRYPSPMKRNTTMDASTSSFVQPTSSIHSAPVIQGSTHQPSLSPNKSYHGVIPSFNVNRDEDIEVIPGKELKPHHRSGGGSDIRKLRQHFMVRQAAAVISCG